MEKKNSDLRHTFADIYRRVPGRYTRLQDALEAGTPDVADDFRRLLRFYEDEINQLQRKVRMPWLG